MPGQLEVTTAEVVELLLGEVLDADQLVAGILGGIDQLVELQVNGLCLSVLGMADEEEQQEADARRDDGEGRGPGLVEPAIGANAYPGEYEHEREVEALTSARRAGHPEGNAIEAVVAKG